MRIRYVSILIQDWWSSFTTASQVIENLLMNNGTIIKACSGLYYKTMMEADVLHAFQERAAFFDTLEVLITYLWRQVLLGDALVETHTCIL